MINFFSLGSVKPNVWLIYGPAPTVMLISYQMLFNSAKRVMTASTGPQVVAPAAGDRLRGLSDFCLAHSSSVNELLASVCTYWTIALQL